MKIFKNVKSSQESIPHIEVDVDTVYVRTDITDFTSEDGEKLKNIGQEIHYNKDNFIELISKKNEELELQLVESSMENMNLMSEIMMLNELNQSQVMMEVITMISQLQGGE